MYSNSVEVSGTHPFNSNLIDPGFRPGRIFLLANDPQRVIREQRVMGDAFDRYSYLMGKALFTELQQSYGIYVPDIHIILGASTSPDNSKSLYVVTDMIRGKNLDHPEVFAGCDLTVAAPKMDRFCASLAQYYWDKRLNGEEYLSDLYGSQFVYGRRQNEVESQVYLVDLDPVFDRFHEKQFFDKVSGLGSLVLRTEAKLQGRKLNSARARLLMILQSDEFKEEMYIAGLNVYPFNRLIKESKQHGLWGCLESLIHRRTGSYRG